MSEKRPELGALWKKQGKQSGNEYFTGTLQIGDQKVNVVGFWEMNKRNPRGPDLRLYAQEERRAPDETQSPPREPVNTSDDIPF